MSVDEEPHSADSSLYKNLRVKAVFFNLTESVCFLSSPACYSATNTRSFLRLTAPLLLSELKIASFTLCLIRITKPSHSYKGRSYRSLFSIYTPWLMKKDNTSVVVINNTSQVRFMSSTSQKALLLINRLDVSPCSHFGRVKFLNVTKLSLNVSLKGFCTSNQHSTHVWVIAHISEAARLKCSASTRGHQWNKVAIYCTLASVPESYVWPWMLQVSAPGRLWLFYRVAVKHESWSRPPSRRVRGRWYGALPRIWQP